MTEAASRNHRQVVIIDPLGLHLRPAAKLVVLSKSFRSEIRLVCKGNTANARSILELMALAAECGTAVDIVADGPDAEEAVAALTDSIGAGLDGPAIRVAAAA